VEELKRFCQKIHHFSGGLLVDLTGVTFIDQEGQALLSRLWQEGADLRATGCYVKTIVEKITSSGWRVSPTDMSKKSSATSRARSRRS
jgi:anti-anti-sigma regulatory factor